MCHENCLMIIPAAVTMTPIGVVRSEFQSKVGVPIQTAGAPHRCAELEIFPAYAAGLRDLDGFEYLILLTYMPVSYTHLDVYKRQAIYEPHGLQAL